MISGRMIAFLLKGTCSYVSFLGFLRSEIEGRFLKLFYGFMFLLWYRFTRSGRCRWMEPGYSGTCCVFMMCGHSAATILLGILPG